MNCSYHAHNAAVVSCNGCGKPLCPACDHRIKGFPFCQDCIVTGVEMLRNRGGSGAGYVPLIKKQSSPVLATLLSFVCPGLGAAYNGQTSKALVYFAVFAGLFQMAVLTGAALFVLGFLGMWLFAAVDAWRTAQLIRSGITPDGAEDLIVRRFSGNPKLWGGVLILLGIAFVFRERMLLRSILPVLLIGLGIYLLREYIFKSRDKREMGTDFPGRAAAGDSSGFMHARGETSFRTGEFETDYKRQSRNWKGR